MGDIVVIRKRINLAEPAYEYFIRRLHIANGMVMYVADNGQYPSILKTDDIELVGIVSKRATEFGSRRTIG